MKRISEFSKREQFKIKLKTINHTIGVIKSLNIPVCPVIQTYLNNEFNISQSSNKIQIIFNLKKHKPKDRHRSDIWFSDTSKGKKDRLKMLIAVQEELIIKSAKSKAITQPDKFNIKWVKAFFVFGMTNVILSIPLYYTSSYILSLICSIVGMANIIIWLNMSNYNRS